MLVQPGQFVLGQRVGLDDLDAFGAQQVHQAVEAFLLVLLQAADLQQQLVELLLGRAAVRALGGDAFADLAGEAGDADHEELVEIGCRDRQEADALEQRMARILRFLEHAPVELQPRELAVDEAVRIALRAGVGRGALRDEFLQDGSKFVHAVSALSPRRTWWPSLSGHVRFWQFIS